MKNASKIVTIGNNDAKMDAISNLPLWADKIKNTFASVSPTPVITINSILEILNLLLFLMEKFWVLNIIKIDKNTSENNLNITKGQYTVLTLNWSTKIKNIPNPNPETKPYDMLTKLLSSDSCVLLELIESRIIEIIARIRPRVCNWLGIPWVIIENITGILSAVIADIGDIILVVPLVNPWYNVINPIAPAIPPKADHNNCPA